MGWGRKMSVAKHLYELQEVDLELEGTEQALRRITGQLGEGSSVVKARDNLASESLRLEELKRQQHSLEWEIDDVGAKLTSLEEELYSGRIKNPKELANLQQEASGLKARRSELEDRALDIMGQVEATVAGVASMSSELEVLEAEWRGQQQRLEDEMERLKAMASDLKYKRELLSNQVEPQVVEFYDELKKQKGTAVATVEQGVCQGCRISLSNAELQRARSGGLMQCSSCGRILFLD
jgi:predicted  nucleic acid-binding Zn-ribbon protein